MARQTLGYGIVLCLGLYCVGVQAQVNEHLSQSALLKQAATLAQQQQPQAAWQLLQAHLNEHLRDADYNYQLGVYAAQSGQYAQAINALERVVLIQPQHAGAWLDMSLSYAAVGDYAAAIELAAYIQTHLDPTPHIAQLLQQLTDQWQHERMRLAKQQYRYQVSAALGYSQNPTASTSQDNIPIFLGEWVSLPLSAREKANASLFSELQWQSHHLWHAHRLYLNASARSYDQNHSADQYTASMNWLLPEDSLGFWQVGVDHFDVQFAGEQDNLFLARHLLLSPQWQLRLGYRLRRSDRTSYDANLPSFTVSYYQTLSTGNWLRAYAGYESDQPLDSTRPGGSGDRWLAGIYWDGALSAGKRLSLSYALNYYQDQQRYSSLIPLNRQLTWQQWRAQLTLPIINAHWSLSLVAQYEQQSANHELFSWNDTQVLTKLSYAF